jgi:hypothetical protein
MERLQNRQKGLRHITPLIALILIVFRVTNASAAEWGGTYIALLKFSAGIVTAFAIHEGAHALVADLTDTELDWEVGTFNQPLGFHERATNNSRGYAVHSAGLVAQTINSEIILQSDSIDKNDAFVRGMMAWNIINPISYAADYWFIHRTNKKTCTRYQGDLQGVEHYSSKSAANGFAGALVAISVFQGYRFLKTQSWAPKWLKNSDNVALEPLSSDGAAIKYNIRF